MRTVSGKALVRALERDGWTVLKVNGSHHILGKEGYRARLTVPVHGNQPLKRGLLASLLKTANLSEDDI